MIRRTRLPTAVLAATLLAALALPACGPEPDGAGEPAAPRGDLSGANLLLVTVDTLRADRVGAYGHAAADTPTLDDLAAGGVRVRDVYAPVPLTLPSHAVMFTGRRPFELGVRVNGIHYLGEGATTLAEVLRDAGYTTAAAVSAYVLGARFGLDQGFGRYDDRLEGGGLRGFENQVRAETVVGRAIRWLEGAPATPWFAWVHLYDPHLPYDPPGEWGRRFADAPYDGEVAYADHWIGRLLQTLESRGLDGDTLVVVTSDHGEGFGEHGEEGHGLLVYDESLRVPLILRAPGRLPAGRVVERRVHLADLAPTLLDLLGVETPPGMGGVSAAGAIAGEAQTGETQAGETAPRYGYFESLEGQESKSWAPLVGVMDDRWKLISAPRPELYDLRTDPGETENVLRQERRHYRRLDDALQAMLLTAAGEGGEDGGATGDGNRRALTAEDRAALRALGYLSPAASSGEPGLDPKVGIRVEARVREVREALRDGDTAAATDRFDALLADHGDLSMPDFHLLRHELAAARGRTGDAVAALRRGVEAFPTLAALRWELAGYLAEVGRQGEAEEVARELLADDPRFTQALQLLAIGAERREAWGEALEYYRRALAVDEGSVELRLKVAGLEARLGRLPAARAAYGPLLASGALDERPQELFRVAMLDARLGDMASAESLFRRGLALRDGGVHRLAFATLLLQAGRGAEAAEQLRGALDASADPLNDQQRQMARALLARLEGG